MEQIYTIPINEVFEEHEKQPSLGCPLCHLYEKLEENELDLILGASMMEPDIRIKTNQQGFCRTHYGRMLGMKNRLGLGLMLESHLSEVAKGLDDSLLGLLPGQKGNATLRYIDQQEKSCYVCGKVEYHFERMCSNLLVMYSTDSAFRRKYAAQPHFCLPHVRALGAMAKKKMTAKDFSLFWDQTMATTRSYLSKLREDVSWFCKKFDYRYENEPWYDAKDAVIRAADLLTGKAKKE